MLGIKEIEDNLFAIDFFTRMGTNYILSLPMLYKEGEDIQIAFFLTEYDAWDIENRKISAPSYILLCDIEKGYLQNMQKLNNYDNRKFSVDSNVKYDRDFEKNLLYRFDIIRHNLISNKCFNNEYKEYLSLVESTLNDEYKDFIKIHYSNP